MECQRIERLLKIITLLEGNHKKWTVRDLAEYFNISVRTVHRDRQALENIGVPLYYDSDKKTYNILDTFSFTPPEFTRDEAVALSLAARTFQSENSPYKRELDMALAKILNSLPMSISDVIKNLDNRLLTLNKPSVDLTEYQDLISSVEKAIELKKCIEIEYNSLADSKVRKRKLDPYNLILKDGACYLVGYCHLREDIRTFRIDRVKSFELLNNTFKIKNKYSADEYFRYSWGIERGKEYTVKLIFKDVASRLIKEYQWHPSQEIRDLPDGRTLFQVRTGSRIEMKRWIMSFGSEVEVKEPDWLRDEIVKELERTLNNY
ncbi:MAG: helix-turn-helix transcriptional regulator [bacterium]